MDILEKIVVQKQKEIAAAKKRTPEKTLRDRTAVRQHRRPFFARLAQPGPSGVNIIAEIKRASPSKGMICPDLDPVRHARLYEQGGASAISVLTDPVFFHGSAHDLIDVRKAVTLPVLRKDFLISAYQVYESAAMGADAILLIARILTQTQLGDYLKLAGELGMDTLVEIHCPRDLDKASSSGARLIGINNRDLSSFRTDLQHAAGMVSLLGPGMIPVAESGIKNREDILQLNRSGIHNFLIGESLVRSEDCRVFLEHLLGIGQSPDKKQTTNHENADPSS
ncbi:MAG: indole-3-glycerol phosphate synthase TrpC [Desulfobacterales bacterium]|nr:indole-3-glycerol phosphate synthase TrpC [Desulfobacterales bacterium]